MPAPPHLLVPAHEERAGATPCRPGRSVTGAPSTPEPRPDRARSSP
ncbi:hypothetical protein ACFW2Y_10095 [Streptomyces sp. NPDC058877]